MAERLGPGTGRPDMDKQVFFDFPLSDVLLQHPRAQGCFDGFALGRGLLGLEDGRNACNGPLNGYGRQCSRNRGRSEDVLTNILFYYLMCILVALHPIRATISPCMTMSNRTKLIVTAVLLLVLAGMAGIDYWMTGTSLSARLALTGEELPENTENKPENTPVAKSSGPAVKTVMSEAGLEVTASDEPTFLSQIINEGLTSVTVLKDGDRAGSVTWIESPDVKDEFIALKDGLLESFSAGLHDLKDTTEQEPNRPVRNVLRFTDPALSDEELVFVRVRERLFEFHLAPGSEETMNALIDALTAK
jgi:hypothetical protein